MLNKDYKVRNNKNKKQNTRKVSQKRTRSSSSKANKNAFFYVMIVLWIIPVFISAYILYNQYNIYVDKRKKQHIKNKSQKPPISREQITKLRKEIKRKEFISENGKTNNLSSGKKIYLVKVNRTLGRVYLKSIETDNKNLDKVDTAIKRLISYKLNSNLKKQSFYTCIPNKTKLLGYKLKNGTLYLNFNKGFMDYSKGRQQIKLKAAQIVYTATQFNGVKRVKFIINNKELKDWGGEGVFYSSILSRSDVPRIMSIQ